jgi:AraC family transcriptional regulator
MLELLKIVTGEEFLAKIAVDLDLALPSRAASGGPGSMTPHLLAKGDGWTVSDVICTSGPHDRSFEEQHPSVCVAIITAGSFEYRTSTGKELMTPGSLMLGNQDDYYECGHQHGTGDRCLSFRYSMDYFEYLAADAGVRKPKFGTSRLPPLRELSALVAQACTGVAGATNLSWEELGIQLAAKAVQLSKGIPPVPNNLPPAAVARMSRAVRMIEQHPDDGLSLRSLAGEAGLNPYHFLRTFQQLTGVTPHQYILRARLREAAMRLVEEPARVLDIALDCGFGDVSNFNHAFRAEFGMSPRAYRLQARRRTRRALV